jgi:2-phosphoglycerate kinase
MPPEKRLPWDVLLIAGPSGVGKSTAAKQIGQRFGVPWLQVDDLRLALQWSQVRMPDPEDTRKLYFFDSADVWQLSPERLRDGFIGVGEALSPAIAKVITNHVAIAEPIVLEGDGLLPSLLARPEVEAWNQGRRVRAVVVTPPDEEAILANMLARGRGIPGRSESELQTNARANWLYGEWLAAEARRFGVPVLGTEPQDSLGDRIAVAVAPPRGATDDRVAAG